MTTIALNNLAAVGYRKDFHAGKTASTLGGTMKEQVSDEILMCRYQQGDDKAFNLLFNRHKDAVFRYLERQCTTSIAEEIFQDVWLKLIQARNQFQSSDNSRFAPYLYRIAHNRLMDYFRSHSVKSRVISEVEINPDTNELLLSRDNPSSLESQIDAHRKIEKLLSLIEQLSVEQREAFLLKEESGLSIQDIADITGVSRETAKSRLRYAFQRVRDGMREIL